MDNLETKPTIAYSEMKVRCIINQIEKKLDKNRKDFWVLKTQLDKQNKHDYLAFSADYSLSAKAKSLLTDSSEKLINNWAILTIKKKNNLEKVIEIHLEKQHHDTTQ